MNTLLAFAWPFSETVVERLGWTLVHSLWQFALVALLSGVAGRAMQRTSSTLRYYLLVTAMIVSVAAPVATWLLMPRDIPTTLASPAAIASEQHLGDAIDPRTGVRLASDGWLASDAKRQSPAPDSATSETQPVVLPQATAILEPESSWSERTKTAVRPWLAWIVAGWSLGVVVCSVRPLLGWHTLWRLKRVGVSPVSDDMFAALHRVSERLGLRRGAVQLLQSTLAQVPIVVGYFRPVILLPVSLVTSIPAAQLEAILAHELAHVQRHDFVVNLLQTLVETLFFYHPAVWWLSRQIRVEREHCCDDLVVKLLDNRVEYGRALVAIEQQRGKRGNSVLALGAADGSLLSRVRRIVGSNPERTASSQVERWPAALLGIVLLSIATVLSLTWNLAAKDEPQAELATYVANLPNGVTDRIVDGKPIEASSIQAGAIRPGEWPMWGGSSHRNHVANGQMPTEWDLKTGRNVQWKAKLGTAAYASPVVSGGKVFLGTNNAAGLDPRRPKQKDLSCLLCVDQTTGNLLWQYASEKLPQGRAHDWPEIGLCSTACVEEDRLWVVTNRCEVLCLDTNGFRDGENDGDYSAEIDRTEMDADVVWKFDMFNTLGVRPLHQAVSSIAVVDGVVLLNTSNGPDESRQNVPAPKAPHFLALDAGTGRVLWQDNSAGESIIVGGSSCGCSGTSPAVATIGGVTQAIFAGREGWLYGFDFADLKQGKTTRLWQFDCNPKTSKYNRGSQSTRNTLVGSPVVVGDRVFIATGRNPEEGEGPGDLWCIDAQKRGDISSELVFNKSHRDGQEPIPHKPLSACDPKQGDFTRPNPNSGAIWHYVGTDRNKDGKLGFDEAFHRSISNPTIHDGLLFIPDFSGLLHCVDARTGEGLWTHDLLAAVWSSCVIVEGQVLIGDEDGDIAILNATRTYQPVHDEPENVGTPIYSTPAVVNHTLFVAGKDTLVAMGGEQPKAPRPQAVPGNALGERDSASHRQRHEPAASAVPLTSQVPGNENPAEKAANSGVQAIPPLLEFRIAAQPADSKIGPRVPADFEKREYAGNSVIGRMVAKDKGFVWVAVPEAIPALPVERPLKSQAREALLADTAEHVLAWNGKWSFEDCRVVPDPNGTGMFSIALKLNEAGGAALRTLTKSHLNQPLAIVVNNKIIAAPIVRSEIGRDIVITGNFTREYAERLAAALTVRPPAAPGIENKLGTLSGRFIYDGEPPARKDWYSSFAEIDVSQPQQPGPGGRFSGVEGVYRDFLKHKIRPKTEDGSMLVSKDGGVANVVVWVVSRGIPWSRPPGEFVPAVIQLKDGNFSPRFAAVTVGQPLLIENKDPVSLNFAAEFSRALNPSFNVLLPSGTTVHCGTFRAPEPYPASYQSNLAPWANGRVFVHANPFVAVSQPDGSFTLPNLPTGDWEFQVWHERGGYVQHWPKGRFQQSIKPGDNKLGTIKLKPEHLGQEPVQASATTPPPKNREQIGEVLGKPVYRDEVTDDTLQGIFLKPVLAKYQEAHRAAITPTEDELKFAAEFFDNEHRKRLDAAGGEAKIREQMKALEEQLARTDLSADEQQKLESAHLGLRYQLKPPGRLFAEFMLNNWKFQKHLYNEFGGGRILWQQAGQEAFDATRTCLESLEKKGEFKITDAALRAKLFDYWTRSHGSFLTDDQERIRQQFLEPGWIAPGAGKIPSKDK